MLCSSRIHTLTLIIFRLFFAGYLILVGYATYREIWKDDLKDMQDKPSTKKRIIPIFSIQKNWYRLVTIKDDNSNQWGAVQGVRFYNQLIVILTHTVVMCFNGPVANTKYTEGVSRRYCHRLLENICENFRILS